MSLLTDGTGIFQPIGTIWPGVVDPKLWKLKDVALPGGKRIFLADYGESDALISLPNRGEARDPLRLLSKLGDSHLFENDYSISKHLYNPKEESIPNTKLLSVRDWR
jgi:hypothetical protein